MPYWSGIFDKRNNLFKRNTAVTWTSGQPVIYYHSESFAAVSAELLMIQEWRHTRSSEQRWAIDVRCDWNVGWKGEAQSGRDMTDCWISDYSRKQDITHNLTHPVHRRWMCSWGALGLCSRILAVCSKKGKLCNESGKWFYDESLSARIFPRGVEQLSFHWLFSIFSVPKQAPETDLHIF